MKQTLFRQTVTSYDASRVTSKLKQDRNYQPPRPPRRPKQFLSEESGQSSQKRPELQRQKSVKDDIGESKLKTATDTLGLFF